MIEGFEALLNLGRRGLACKAGVWSRKARGGNRGRSSKIENSLSSSSRMTGSS